MQLTQVAYGGCWKCPHAWQRCSASTPRLAASQKGFVHSFGVGIGLVTSLQSLIRMASSLSLRPSHPLHAAELGGIRAILVHAISDDAKRFYERHGCVESPVDPMTLTITIADARKALGSR